MNPLKSVRLPIPLRFLALTILTAALFAGTIVPVFAADAAKERASSAAQQLREYSSRLRQSAMKARVRGVTSAEPQVSIRLNPAMSTSSTIFFYDDFDASTHAWTTALYGGTTDDLWHVTSLSAASPTHSMWAGVEGQGTYATGRQINTAVISPPIDLTAAAGPVHLLFAESYMTERGWDYCMVDASTDGSTWTHLRGGYGPAPSGDSYGWKITALDLTAFAGQTISLRFYFNTGDSVLNAFPGWFVDDIIVFDQGGTIAGRKFFDVNNNSAKDVGERGIKDWTITATGPVMLTTKTNVRGHYKLPLPLGTYTVSETFEPNWTQKFPIAGTWTVTLATPDTLIDSLWFGNYTQASFVNGLMFHDLNNNGLHDGGDTLLPGWKVFLEDTLGNVLDYDLSDTDGTYQLYVFQPGRYVISANSAGNWIDTYPPGWSYTVDIPDLHTVSDSNNFGRYYSPTPPPQTSGIDGWVYDDRNRNGIRDSGETGIIDFTVQLLDNTTPAKPTIVAKTLTDSAGAYHFSGVPAGTYRVHVVPVQGWWQSAPPADSAFAFDTTARYDTIAFGLYQIVAGSAAGTVYHDRNGNGVRDSSEDGLSNWHILLGGTNYFGQVENRSVYSDGNGAFTLAGLWPGTYAVSEVWKNGWTQTAPPGTGLWHLTLGPEEIRPGVDFGNIDSVYKGTFRTFRMDSLAYAVDLRRAHKPMTVKPTTMEFTTTVIDTFTTHTVKSVVITFGLPYVPGTLTASLPGTLTPIGLKFRKIQFTFDTELVTGDSLVIHGLSIKVKPQTAVTIAYLDNLTKGGALTRTSFVYRLPMPNALNVVQMLGAVQVGLGGPHSVVHPSYKEVVKSLFDAKHGVHIGDPRCIDKTSTGQSIKRRLGYLPPQKHNNRLFAELIAFRVNILASDMGQTPAGLGNLVYDDGSAAANPMNGLTLREIAAKADSFMSSFRDTIGQKFCHALDDFPIDPDTFYTKLREIDSAFSGPIDTVVWSSDNSILRLKGVRPLSEVGFLRFDAAKITPAGAATKLVVPVPDRFTLFQNYPNPFNPSTTFSFYLTDPAVVTLRIYNVLGQEVARVLDRQPMDDGAQEIDFAAGSLPSGVYFYQLRADVIANADLGIEARTLTAVRKMVLMK